MYVDSELVLFGRVPQTLAAVQKANVCGSLLFRRAPQTLAAVRKANVCGSLLFRRFPHTLAAVLKASVCGSLLFRCPPRLRLAPGSILITFSNKILSFFASRRRPVPSGPASACDRF